MFLLFFLIPRPVLYIKKKKKILKIKSRNSSSWIKAKKKEKKEKNWSGITIFSVAAYWFFFEKYRLESFTFQARNENKKNKAQCFIASLVLILTLTFLDDIFLYSRLKLLFFQRCFVSNAHFMLYQDFFAFAENIFLWLFHSILLKPGVFCYFAK